jgi:hypothetical protein
MKKLKTNTSLKKNPIQIALLDFFLASEDLLSMFLDVAILPKYKSDHAPVVVCINNSNTEHEKGYWKINT